MADRQPVSLPITLAGQPQASETLAATVGAYVVVLATTLPDYGVTVTSTYLGYPGADTQATHLLLAPGRGAGTRTDVRSEHSIPVTHARRHCLTDHAAVLLAHLRDLGHEPGIEITDAAIAELEIGRPELPAATRETSTLDT